MYQLPEVPLFILQHVFGNSKGIIKQIIITSTKTKWLLLLFYTLKNCLVQRNTKINEKRNGVITLLWRLPLQENPDHKKVFHLYIIQLWYLFFHISIHADVVDVQTWEVSPLKNPVKLDPCEDLCCLARD